MKGILCITLFFLFSLFVAGCSDTVMDANKPDATDVETINKVDALTNLSVDMQGALAELESKFGSEMIWGGYEEGHDDGLYEKNDQASTIQSRKRRFDVYLLDVEGSSLAYGQPFEREALLIKTDRVEPFLSRNGYNRHDFLLFSGSPAITPEAGSIWFATNSRLHQLIDGVISGNDHRDFVDMTYSPLSRRYDIEIDRLQSYYTQMNIFNSASGFLTAHAYKVMGGTMMFDFRPGTRTRKETLTGRMNLNGSGHQHEAAPSYNARLNGVYLGYFIDRNSEY